ncbi:hypothetical protein [Actinophytocola gossypii]|uniref:Uncharacterized protein n=1 Tax=Actinophytocola gossypii TaxID=2812003 RepID=A0ABT2JKN2_9PSEU|nr:hypothetical protein [Actinophytocola gossypii]MCT2587950.1 hypothetical protein [Actinophytocola gossypii]
MAQIDPIPDTTRFERVAEPHQSTVAAIVCATERGLLTAAQAQVMIDRVRAHLTVRPVTGAAMSSSSGTLLTTAVGLPSDDVWIDGPRETPRTSCPRSRRRSWATTVGGRR